MSADYGFANLSKRELINPRLFSDNPRWPLGMASVCLFDLLRAEWYGDRIAVVDEVQLDVFIHQGFKQLRLDDACFERVRTLFACVHEPLPIVEGYRWLLVQLPGFRASQRAALIEDAKETPWATKPL